MSTPDIQTDMHASSLRQVIGALVFGAEGSLSVESIRKCLRGAPAADDGQPAPFAEVQPRDIREALEDIAKDLDRLDIGIELREVAGGFRFQTQPGCGRWVRTLLRRDRPSRLSRSALETLAIIAYRQPIAKSELEGIRGVSVDHTIKALMEMHLVRSVGRSDLPGRPFLYGTTTAFLEHFGLKSLDDLNEIDPTLQRGRPSATRPAREAKAAEPPAEAAGEPAPAKGAEPAASAPSEAEETSAAVPGAPASRG